jgi:Ras-related protein Rab-2A
MVYARYKLCIFGDGGVGKTTLTHRFLQGVFKEDYHLTIGMDFYLKKIEINDKIISLQIWDFAGEEKFRFLLPSAIMGANGALFMYDITRYQTFNNLDNWLSVFNETIKKEGLLVSTILVGSKIDLAENRAVSIEEAMRYNKERKFQDFIECSSKTGENVETIFKRIGEIMIKNTPYLKNKE